MWLWAFGRAVLLPLYRLLLRVRVEGIEHVPASGGVIICSNHISAHDPPLLGMLSPRLIRFMAKDEIFRVPVIGWLAEHGGGAIAVKRGTPDRAALKQSLEILASGGCFGIFPEGTRSRTGSLGKAEPGTAYLALKSGVAVIPAGFSGTYRLFSSVTLRFGPPVDLSAFQGSRLTGENLDAAGGAIMAAIASLIDQRFRGQSH